MCWISEEFGQLLLPIPHHSSVKSVKSTIPLAKKAEGRWDGDEANEGDLSALDKEAPTEQAIDSGEQRADNGN